MTPRTMKRSMFFLAAWVFAMCALFGMAWVFDVRAGDMTSWRFFSMYAVLFTFGPLVAVCLFRGLDQ